MKRIRIGMCSHCKKIRIVTSSNQFIFKKEKGIKGYCDFKCKAKAQINIFAKMARVAVAHDLEDEFMEIVSLAYKTTHGVKELCDYVDKKLPLFY